MRNISPQASQFKSVLDSIGQTPLVALDRIGHGLPNRILAKLEFYSPGGSIKDRAALRMIEAAEQDGRLQPGGTVIELTSGNMGTGLAIVCAVKGYQMVAVMSEGNSLERRRMLTSYGARVELVPQVGKPRPGQVSKEDLELVEQRTKELVDELGAFWPDQFRNTENAAAHEITTASEIWEQTAGTVTHFTAMAGTGGTLLGVARGLKKCNSAIRCYVGEPATAPYLAGKAVVDTSHQIQGTGYAHDLDLWDDDLVDGYLTATDDESIETARLLATREGIFGGFSGGANVSCALRLAKEIPLGSVVVTVIPDTGLKYLSTDLYPE